MGPKTFEFNFKGIQLNTFRTGDKIKIGSIEVEPIHVDHSVPGAYGFLIHTSEGCIVYTGDFRAHGTKPDMTQQFIDEASKASPVAMVTEATNTTGASPSSENGVEQKLTEVVGQARGIVLGDFAKAE